MSDGDAKILLDRLIKAWRDGPYITAPPMLNEVMERKGYVPPDAAEDRLRDILAAAGSGEMDAPLAFRRALLDATIALFWRF